MLQIDMGGPWAIGHMGNRAHEQNGILVNTADRHGAPGAIGHMGSRAHG